MKRLTIFLAGAACVFDLILPLRGQTTGNEALSITLSAFCLMGVSGNPSTLTVAVPAQGGQTPANPSDSGTYLRYTSTVASGVTRKITAAWGGTDAAPAGSSLKLTADPSGGANQGASAGQITLSSTAQNIVTGIGGCATGTGATNGARLTYALSINDVTSLVASQNKAATITFTLTDS